MSDKPKDDKSAKTGSKPAGGGKGATETSRDRGTTKTPMPRARKIGIAVLVVIALLGISFFGGWLKGRGAMTDWRERAESAERLSTLYQTRHRLDLAWHAIERDNFGDARKHVGEAAKVLGKGPDDDDMRGLAKELADVQIVVSDDADAQQDKLLGYMKRIDELAAATAKAGGGTKEPDETDGS